MPAAGSSRATANSLAQEPGDGAFGVLDMYLGGGRQPDHWAASGAVTLDEAVEHLALVAGQAGERSAGVVAVLGEEDGAGGLGP